MAGVVQVDDLQAVLGRKGGFGGSSPKVFVVSDHHETTRTDEWDLLVIEHTERKFGLERSMADEREIVPHRGHPPSEPDEVLIHDEGRRHH